MDRLLAIRAVKGLARDEDDCVSQEVFPYYSQRAEDRAWEWFLAEEKHWPDAPITTIALDQLRSRQPVLNFKTLRRYIGRPSKRPIAVIRVGKTFLLWDGNHRATAAAYLGKKRIRCRIFAVCD